MAAPYNIDNYQWGAFTVTTTAQQLLTGDVWDSVTLNLQNDGSTDIYLGRDSTTSSSTAFYRIPAGETVTDDRYQGNLWVISATGSPTLRYEVIPHRERA